MKKYAKVFEIFCALCIKRHLEKNNLKVLEMPLQLQSEYHSKSHNFRTNGNFKETII